MKTWQRILLAKILLWIMWPATVMAAVNVVPQSDDPFAAITTLQLIVMMVVATLSGATALVYRLDNEYKNHRLKKNRSIPLLVSSHMLGSLSAGVLAFALSQMLALHIWGQLVGVICASFMGAKFVESIANSYVKNMTDQINKDKND